MSTRSFISVRISDADINKIMKVNTKMFNPESGNVRSAGYPFLFPMRITDPKIVDEKTQPVALTDRYIAVYHNSDGCHKGIGERLLNHYNDYAKALNLVLGGHMGAAADSGSIPSYYATRDRWEDSKPFIFHNQPSPGFDIEYCYLFEDGRWTVMSNTGSYQVLTERF